MPRYQPDDPEIALFEREGEVTLMIDGDQAMQAWERELMCLSADLLCQFGSTFLEVGLGLGISALRIAGNPRTQHHVVIEKYRKVIDLFLENNPSPPSALEIVHADFFDYVPKLQGESFDGIFFDPHLPKELREDEALWQEIVPQMVRTLRKGGALVPCFSSYPVLRWQFVPFFDRVVVDKVAFNAYRTTNYMAHNTGYAFIQQFIKTR
jgi:predicted methyltransferase